MKDIIDSVNRYKLRKLICIKKKKLFLHSILGAAKMDIVYFFIVHEPALDAKHIEKCDNPFFFFFIFSGLGDDLRLKTEVEEHIRCQQSAIPFMWNTFLEAGVLRAPWTGWTIII